MLQLHTHPHWTAPPHIVVEADPQPVGTRIGKHLARGPSSILRHELDFTDPIGEADPVPQQFQFPAVESHNQGSARPRAWIRFVVDRLGLLGIILRPLPCRLIALLSRLPLLPEFFECSDDQGRHLRHPAIPDGVMSKMQEDGIWPCPHDDPHRAISDQAGFQNTHRRFFAHDVVPGRSCRRGGRFHSLRCIFFCQQEFINGLGFSKLTHSSSMARQLV
jgi:hypothetical protein